MIEVPAFPRISLFPSQKMLLQCVDQERHTDDHDADHQQTDDRSCIIAKVRVIFHIVAHTVAGADHLGGGQEDEADGQALVASKEDLRERSGKDDVQEHRRLADVEDLRGVEDRTGKAAVGIFRPGKARPRRLTGGQSRGLNTAGAEKAPAELLVQAERSIISALQIQTGMKGIFTAFNGNRVGHAQNTSCIFR